MMASLVYSGEHWVIDTLIGIGYAVTVLLAVDVLERLRRRHRGRRSRGIGDTHRRTDTDPARVAAFGDEHAPDRLRQAG